jgi:hypothetical protein
MSWTDKKAVEVIKFIRDKFKVTQFVETGTFKGINLQLHSKNFKSVVGCELVKDYYFESCERLCGKLIEGEAYIWNESSPVFLKSWISQGLFDKMPIIYLDAHFYDAKLPKNKRFVVIDELKALKGFKDCIIIIHDFKNNLGHINYDNIPLDFGLLESHLNKVNPEFHFYTNTLEGCDIVKNDIDDIKAAGLPIDEVVLDNLKYVWSSPVKTYRGILYCLPSKLSDKEMRKLGLTKWGVISDGTKSKR